jgi:hypothetical protein
MSATEEVYSGLATWGKVSSWIIAIFVSLISVAALYKQYTNVHTASVTGKVLSSVCKQNVDAKNNITYDCLVSASYTVNGQQYQADSTVNPSLTEIKTNDDINVNYNPANPSDSVVDIFTTSFERKAVVTMAVVFLLLAWLNVWLVTKYKFFASIRGAESISDMFF